MSNYQKIKSLADNILVLAQKELEYLKENRIEQEKLDKFVKEKEGMRKEMDTLLPSEKLAPNEKTELKQVLTAAYDIEIEIGKIYKEKLDALGTNIGNLNREKKLQEAYAKGGMNFTGEKSNDLKKQ